MKKFIQITLIALAFGQPTYVLANNAENNYKTLCVSCHGVKGHGDGIASQSLPEQPSNIYEELTSWFESEEKLIETILNGNDDMPAWKSVLSEKEAKDILMYIRAINESE